MQVRLIIKWRKDFAITMGLAIDKSSIGYSVHPTFFGDCYANFNFWGVFLSIPTAIFVTKVDKYIYNSRNKNGIVQIIVCCIYCDWERFCL